MKEYSKSAIMNERETQFIYYPNGAKRINLIKQMVDEYPIRLNSDNPAAIYVNDINLPKLAITSNSQTQNAAFMFMNFTIMHNILKNTYEAYDELYLDEKFQDIIDYVNSELANKDFPLIKSGQELIFALKQTQAYYFKYLIKYPSFIVSDLWIPNIDLETIITQYKKALPFNSYFNIIVDNQGKITAPFAKVISDIVKNKPYSDIIMKIITQQEDWPNYETAKPQKLSLKPNKK